MNEKIQIYKRNLEGQLRSVERVIALKERSRSRILEKLKDVEESYRKELGGGSVKVSKIEGVTPKKKIKTAPEEDLNVPAPAPAPAEEKAESKKSTWSVW